MTAPFMGILSGRSRSGGANRARNAKRPRRGTGPEGSLERATGIEPAWSAWEAEILPLNHARSDKTLYSNLLNTLRYFSKSSRACA